MRIFGECYGRFATTFRTDTGHTVRAVWWQAGKRILRARYLVTGWPESAHPTA